MTGQQLYEAWLEAMLDEGVRADGWEDIPPTDRAAWQAVAERGGSRMTEIRTRHDGLSPTEAAAKLGVHSNTVYKWMQDGLLPFTQIGPHEKSPKRIKPEDLEPFRHGGARVVGAMSPAQRVERLEEAIRRIYRDRRESDKVTAECLTVLPELVQTVGGGP